ncbi:PPC domain-containing protein [Aliikangiella sp. IMCC44359]|uniref:PPC domain-containing protein n=1 Tax=Aliikangiella sp. IMCC44359 TaxID=3459125 RepID=UPI00403B1138
MYVKLGEVPTDTLFDCRPYRWGNNESCSDFQEAGRYYIRLIGYEEFSNLTLVGKENF